MYRNPPPLIRRRFAIGALVAAAALNPLLAWGAVNWRLGAAESHSVTRATAPNHTHVSADPERIEPFLLSGHEEGIGYSLYRWSCRSRDEGRIFYSYVTAAGYPFRAFRCEDGTLIDPSGVAFRSEMSYSPWLGADVPRLFPIGPIWTGILLNTLVYAGSAVLCVAVWKWSARRVRASRGCCIICGYELGGFESCAECGTAPQPLHLRGRPFLPLRSVLVCLALGLPLSLAAALVCAAWLPMATRPLDNTARSGEPPFADDAEQRMTSHMQAPARRIRARFADAPPMQTRFRDHANPGYRLEEAFAVLPGHETSIVRASAGFPFTSFRGERVGGVYTLSYDGDGVLTSPPTPFPGALGNAEADGVLLLPSRIPSRAPPLEAASSPDAPILPYAPVGRGIALNTLVFGAGLWLAFIGAPMAWRWVRRRARGQPPRDEAAEDAESAAL